MKRNDNEITERQRMLVDRLLAARAVLRMRDKAFADEFLPGNYWTWLNAQCQAVSEKTLDGYAAVLPALEAEMAAAKQVFERQTVPVERTFHATRYTRLVEGALKTAIRDGGNRRIIVVLGPTGSGKTALRDHLALRYGARVARATESTRSAFAAHHLAIQQAFGGVRFWSTRVDLEQHTFNLLSMAGPRPVVMYDESLRWGPHCANIAVDINDCTPAVQVVFALPEFVDRLSSKSFAESSQMMRRVLEVVELGAIAADDVKPFVSVLGLNGSTERACREIAVAATEYGRYDFVERVTAALAQSGAHDWPSVEQTIRDERDAIRVARQIEKARTASEARRRRKDLRFAGRAAAAQEVAP